MWSEWEKRKIIIQANFNNFCNARNFPNSKNTSNIPPPPNQHYFINKAEIVYTYTANTQIHSHSETIKYLSLKSMKNFIHFFFRSEQKIITDWQTLGFFSID